VNLRRKIGPLPLWAWLGIAAVLGYLLYRHFSSGGTASQIVQTTPQPVNAGTASTVPTTDLGGATSAGAPADTGATTSDYLSTLGAQNDTLVSALLTQEQDVAANAQAQLAALSSTTTAGSFQTQTQPTIATEPNSGAPIVGYVAPSVAAGTSTPAPAAAATKSSAASSTGGQPFGGVVSHRTLKNGAILTTYASGRQVEQVPGKSPYVVKA
jgi:hypothetical protein